MNIAWRKPFLNQDGLVGHPGGVTPQAFEKGCKKTVRIAVAQEIEDGNLSGMVLAGVLP